MARLPRFIVASVASLLLTAACGSDVVVGSGGDNGSSTAAGGDSASSSTGGTTGSGGAGGQGAGGSGGGTVMCNPNQVVCELEPPVCPAGEVPSVIGNCWGSCVPILSCATEDSCDSCPTGFCAAYSGFATEYRCVLPTSLQCSSLSCPCTSPHFCVAPFDVCTEPGPSTDADVTCVCISC